MGTLGLTFGMIVVVAIPVVVGQRIARNARERRVSRFLRQRMNGGVEWRNF